MPKNARPGYQRFELVLPEPLLEAARERAGEEGLTVLVGKYLSRLTGVGYAPKLPGRPPHPRAPKRRKPGGKP